MLKRKSSTGRLALENITSALHESMKSVRSLEQRHGKMHASCRKVLLFQILEEFAFLLKILIRILNICTTKTASWSV
jgi:hypothetical protein